MMSNLHYHALNEFYHAGWTDANGKYKGEIQEAICNNVLKLLNVIAEEGHSGFSAQYVIRMFNALSKFQPLTPLTGADTEWHNVSEYGGNILYQNLRAPNIFKDDSGAYNIDGKMFWEWVKTYDDNGNPVISKSYYTSYDSRTPVTFPYTMPDTPIYEYRYSDAEPKQPPQNEEGFL